MYVDIHGPSRETNNILYHLKKKNFSTFITYFIVYKILYHFYNILYQVQCTESLSQHTLSGTTYCITFTTYFIRYNVLYHFHNILYQVQRTVSLLQHTLLARISVMKSHEFKQMIVAN